MIIETINGSGIRLTGAPNEKIKDIRAFVENSSVQLWVTVRNSGGEGGEYDVMQYLTPIVAMALSKALDRLAVEALRAAA